MSDPPHRRVAAVVGEPSLRRRYLGSAGWSMAGSAGSQVLNLVAMVAVARLLGKVQYGELGIVMRTTAAFGTFAGIGLGTAATRYLAELRASDPERAGRIWGLIDSVALVTSGLSATLFLCLSGVLSERALKAPHLAPLLCLSVIALVFNTLTGVQNAVLAGFEAFRRTARVQLARGLISLPGMFLLTALLGLPGAVAGLGVVAFGGFAVGRLALHDEARRYGVRFRRRGVWCERGVIWKFSLPILLSGSVLISGEWFCEALLTRQPGGFAQMGLFLAAAQWTSAIEFLQNTLSGPAVSLMSNLYWTDQLARFRKLCLSNIALLFLASGGIGGVVALAAPWIMKAYGPGFGEGTLVLRLVCGMAAVRAVSRATSNVLYAVGKVRVEWACSMVRITVQIGLWYALMSHGAAGLAVAMLGAYVAQVTLQGGYVYGFLRRGPVSRGAVELAGGSR